VNVLRSVYRANKEDSLMSSLLRHCWLLPCIAMFAGDWVTLTFDLAFRSAIRWSKPKAEC